MSEFKSKIFILPGLGNSGEQHWQSQWERQYPELERINQKNWETPVCDDWTSMIDEKVMAHNPGNVVLAAHSLACTTIVHWVKKYNRVIKGALLVAPSDTESPVYPSGTSGFVPVPLIKLPFRSIIITSSDDIYVSPERARFFAECWGSELINIGKAGHINIASGFGLWTEGLQYLRKLDS